MYCKIKYKLNFLTKISNLFGHSKMFKLTISPLTWKFHYIDNVIKLFSLLGLISVQNLVNSQITYFILKISSYFQFPIPMYGLYKYDTMSFE